MKIVVFNVNWIGDVIFSTPVFRTLKENFKNCYVGCILPKRCSELLKHSPFVDEILEFNERAEHKSLLKKIRFIKELRKKKYDLAILLHRSFTRALICYLAGIKERVGFITKKRAFILTKKIPPPSNTLHKQDYYLYILEKLGLKVTKRECEVFVSDKEKEKASRILKESNVEKDEILIGLHLGANWEPKRWPLEYFAELIRLLYTHFKKIKIFITGARSDLDLAKNLINLSKFPLINLVGKTSLLELAALYQKFDLIISGDSGPLHLGATQGTKYIGLYGPTSPQITGVRAKAKGVIIFKDVGCRVPCYEKVCKKNYICMRSIKPFEVFEKVLYLLESK